MTQPVFKCCCGAGDPGTDSVPVCLVQHALSGCKAGPEGKVFMGEGFCGRLPADEPWRHNRGHRRSCPVQCAYGRPFLAVERVVSRNLAL